MLERFLSYSVWNIRIGFSFIAVVIAAALLGAPYAMAVAGIGDFLGAILFPMGPYFPGFTLTAIITALCTALFIHKNATLPKIIASVLINTVVGTLLLNVLWITIINSTSFIAILTARIPQAILMAVIQIVTLSLLVHKNSRLRTALESAISKLR